MLNKAKSFIISLIIGAIVPSFLLFNTASATDYSASITTSGDVELITASGQTIVDHSDINVVTNCRAGYNLTLGTTVNDNNLYLDGDSSNNSANTYITPADGASVLKNSPNTWGYFASFGASPIVPPKTISSAQSLLFQMTPPPFALHLKQPPLQTSTITSLFIMAPTSVLVCNLALTPWFQKTL